MNRTAATSTMPEAWATHVGVGLRLPHLAEVAACATRDDWFEIHPENFVANPHARELLAEIAKRHQLSAHTVGISIASADGMDFAHLARISQFIDEMKPCLVSGHLAWSTSNGHYMNDLLPLPYNEESLDIVCTNVDIVQQTLGRPYLIENPARYVNFSDSTMPETEFLAAIVDRTACGLLCDVSNIIVSAANIGFDARRYIDAFPAAAVREIHLGGYAIEADAAGAGSTILIDSHDTPIAASAWELYAYALASFGPIATIIEWDNDLPPLAALMEEAQRAQCLMHDYLERKVPHEISC